MIHAGTYPPQGWETNVFEAVKRAETENKRIFMNFTGSDWCGFCIQLDSKVFKQEAFQKYAKDNLVLLYLDFPSKVEQSEWQQMHNAYLQQVFSVEGYPQIVVLEPDLQLSLVTGYRDGSAEDYVKHLKEDDVGDSISEEDNKALATELKSMLGLIKEELDKIG